MRAILLPALLQLVFLSACRADSSGKVGLGANGDAETTDADGDGVTPADGDCDDSDAGVSPTSAEICDGIDNNCDDAVDEGLLVPFYADADNDGFGGAQGGEGCEIPADFVGDATDCDDANDDAFPGNDEACDRVDNNCDGQTDEGVTNTYFADADGDGFGDLAAITEACVVRDGYLADSSDCDDADAGVNPAELEICDEKDNDCNGAVDDGVILTWYVDLDDDGYGDGSATQEACAEPTGYAGASGDCDDADATFNPAADESDCTDPADYNCDGSVGYADADGDGFAACEDCDDTQSSVNTDADERCNGADDNCDGEVDEESAIDATMWYLDYDTDGYGASRISEVSCVAPTYYVANAEDCDDTEAAVSPAASEVCNGADDDCDGAVDGASATGGATWYADADADTFGDASSSSVSCEQPVDTVANDDDCDDSDGAIYPGATEVPYDGIDNDCNGGTADDDLDGDGYDAAADCDDTEDTVHPGALEVAYDGVDNDCDAGTPDDDVDEDGFATADECDDADAAVHPDATEDCANAIDDDCDGAIDLDDTECALELTIAVDTNDYDVAEQLGYPTDAVRVRVTVDAGVTVSGSSTSTPAFTTGSLAAGSTVEIVINGTIGGRGGDGACAYGGAGDDGGDAIELTVDTTMDTSVGGVYGGGGGGGAGNDPAGGGGGGGGGQGCDGGSDAAGGYGGDGGTRFGRIAGGDPTLYDGSVGVGGTWGNPGTAGGGGSGGQASSAAEASCCTGQGGGGGGWGGGGGGGLAIDSSRSPGNGGDAGYAVREVGGTATFTGGDDTTHVKGEVGP